MFAMHSASALVRPGDIRQAEYYKSLLDEQWAQVDEDIADRYMALAKSQANGDLRGMRQVRRMIQQIQREQFALDCLREALEHRFFPTRPVHASRVHSFTVEIVRHRSWWSIHIPAINDLTKARHRGDVEMRAREQIALSTGIPIAQVAVEVLGPPL
jgi:hypothetical protein